MVVYGAMELEPQRAQARLEVRAVKAVSGFLHDGSYVAHDLVARLPGSNDERTVNNMGD